MLSKISRGTYTRERVKITAEHVKKARSMLANGRVDGRGHEIVDTACPGLVLRVTPQAATWYLRLREKTVRIGAVDNVPVGEIRDLAQRTRLALKAGQDPRRELRVYEHAMVQVGDPAIAMDAAFPEEVEIMTDAERRELGPWQWQDLLEEFLKVKLPKLDPRYAPLYETYLRHPAFKRIAHRNLTDLTIDDLEWVRDDIIAANTVSTARRSVQQAKEALSWGWKTHARRSGLKTEYEWWQRWTVEYQPGVRDHTPTIRELARTLALAERHRTLGQTEHATSPGTLGMLWAVVLTAQRTYAVSQTKASSLVEWEERPGWWVLGWEASVMKSRYPHGLPLPPLAANAITAPVRRSGKHHGSPWLFPSLRADGPVSPNSVNQLLRRLGGTRNSGSKAAPLEDLLARHAIRPWTPHDVRRTLASFLVEKKLGGAASAILDHSHDKRADERERTAPVTRLHYEWSQKMDLKADGMEVWVKAVMEAYVEERVALDALPPPAPPPRTKRRSDRAPAHV